MTTTINYLDRGIAPEQEQDAFQQLCDYLVNKGKYKDAAAARKDAQERVSFLEKADMFSDDPVMDNASWERKAVHALITAHNLGEVLREHEGRLPDSERPAPKPPVQTNRAAAPVTDAPARSITNVFGSIELDIRTGLSREQVITKLVDDGMAVENAGEAYDFVHRQRRKKNQNRLIAAAAIVILSVLFFYLSELFL